MGALEATMEWNRTEEKGTEDSISVRLFDGFSGRDLVYSGVSGQLVAQKI